MWNKLQTHRESPSPRAALVRARLMLVLLLAVILNACSVIDTPYRAYDGGEKPRSQLALVQGDFYYRKDWLNSYVDAVRVQRVDDHYIANSRAWDQVLMQPGMRELEVYYSWDMGARMGLAPALASYASSRESVSRTLQFWADPGKTYSVKAEPVFTGNQGDISSLDHVDFWVEDAEGRVVLSREEGRFQSAPEAMPE